MAPAPQQLLTVDALKTHVREAVALLAASANPLLYRNHLLALFLLKRVNDLFAERRGVIEQEALHAGRSPEEARAHANDPDEHRWFVPPSARWENFKTAAENLGAQIERACAEMERHNKNLLGAVLTPLRFEASGAAAEIEPHEALLRSLLEHFDKLTLGDHALQGPAVVGKAAEFLLEHLATWGVKKGASFTSSAALMQLLAELLRPEPSMRVCDPACGAGGALLACADYLQHRGLSPQTLSLHGQEYDAGTWALCKMNLLLHDLPDARIALGSTLSRPLLDDAGSLLQFDLVIAEPPFTLAEWEHEEAARVSFGRFEAGLPPPRRGEFAFVQHIAATLNARGRAAVVVSHGLLFRGGSEKQIRAALLQPETDLVEAVIALPEGVLLGLKAPSAVLILNRNKPEERRERVLFIDAALIARSARAFQLDEATRRKLVALYQGFDERTPLSNAHAAASASLQEIAVTHDFNLNVARYVTASHESHHCDIGQALAELEELDRQKLAADAAMQRMLRQFGYGHDSAKEA